MSAKHTPGPWRAEGYEVYQRGTGTRHIAYTGPHHTPPDEYPKSCRAMDEANALLIAAAPELLEVLETFPGFTDNAIVGDAWIEKVRAVTAKATGKEPA